MNIKYRPEIDGLRALAVFAVIIYHTQIIIFNSQFLKGGFLGVDIFFVISGYLITKIIYKELIQNKNINFNYFYERRIRRIIPALLSVTIFSLILGWQILYPEDLIDFIKSIIFSLGFTSNFYFHYSGQIYGAESGFYKPFLHSWSLSVEEQYYIFFPIIFYLTFKYFKKYLLQIFFLGFFLSIFFAEWASKSHPSFNFYMLPARGWELICGSILAFMEMDKKKYFYKKNSFIYKSLPMLGLTLIVISFIFFHDRIHHPSLITIIPVAGVSLMIHFSNSNEITYKIFTSKILVFFGLLSYSLYLWHYPILTFDKILEFSNESISKKILIFIFIIIFSIISYFFIEKPARNKKNSFKLIISLIGLTVLTVVLISDNIIKNRGFNKNFPLNLDISTKPNVKKILERNNCEDLINCDFRNLTSKNNLILIGDSHMETIFPIIYEKYKNQYNLVTSLMSGCQLILNTNRVNKRTNKISDCNSDTQNQRLKFLENYKNSIVIIGGRLPLIINEERFNNYEGAFKGEMIDYMQNDDKSLNSLNKRQNHIFKNYQLTIEKLLEFNNKIIIVYPIPEVGWNVRRKIHSHFIKNKSISLDVASTSYEIFKSRTESSFNLLNKIKHKNILKIYPHNLFCDNLLKNRCISHNSKKLFYSDSHHMSTYGAEEIANLIIKKINNFQKKSK